MAKKENPMAQVDELFAKEEKELDEQIAKLKHDQELLREGPLSAFISVPKEMDQGPHLPGIG